MRKKHRRSARRASQSPGLVLNKAAVNIISTMWDQFANMHQSIGSIITMYSPTAGLLASGNQLTRLLMALRYESKLRTVGLYTPDFHLRSRSLWDTELVANISTNVKSTALEVHINAIPPSNFTLS